VAGSESFLPDPETAGVLGHFQQAELVKIEGAGHWVQHDKPAEIVDVLTAFLAAPAAGEAATLRPSTVA
jgi:pimeloyl-ACP methyl ester carboxylesterase